MEQYILLAIISMLFFGINSVMLKNATKIDSVTLSLVAISTAAMAILICWGLFFQKKEITSEGIAYGIGAGLVYTVAFVLFVMALQTGKTSVVVTINALSAGIAVLLSVIVFRENLSITQIMGIVLGIVATILLTI